MTGEERERIEAALEARLAELVRTRAALVRPAEGMRGSELSGMDQPPADGASEL